MAGAKAELSTSVLSRLNKVERELKLAKECVRKKDEEIRLLKEGRGSSSGSHSGSKRDETQELRQYVKALRAEIVEMKHFLNDYGLVWIGNSSTSSQKQQKGPASVLQSKKKPAPQVPTKPWVPSPQDLKAIEKNVEYLSSIAGKNDPRSVVTLAIYQDGITFNSTTFRPFTDKSTQRVLQDLVDGYFPQELKFQYPEGVKMRFISSAEKTYEQATMSAAIKKAKPKDNIRQLSNLDDADESPSTQSFLERIPKTVIQNGKIVQVSF